MRETARQIQFGDYAQLFQAFNECGAEVLVVGGQAVNFWAEVLHEEEPELLQYRPFTSADLDLLRPDAQAWNVLRARADRSEPERDPFGKAFTIVGHTFFLKGKDGRTLPVDELKIVAGLRPEELQKGAVVVE